MFFWYFFHLHIFSLICFLHNFNFDLLIYGIGKIQLCDKLEALPKTEQSSKSGDFNSFLSVLIILRFFLDFF